MEAIIKLPTSDSVKFYIFILLNVTATRIPSFKTKNAKKNQDKVTYIIIMKYGTSGIRNHGLLC